MTTLSVNCWLYCLFISRQTDSICVIFLSVVDSSGGDRVGKTQCAASQRAEAAQPAGEHDDLLVLAGAAQRVEHALNPVVIAVDESIVENDGDGPSSLGEHRAHSKTDENGNLLLRAVGEAVERLRSIALDAGD